MLRKNCSPKTVKKTIRSGYVALYVYNNITDMYRKRSVEIKERNWGVKKQKHGSLQFPAGVREAYIRKWK